MCSCMRYTDVPWTSMYTSATHSLQVVHRCVCSYICVYACICIWMRMCVYDIVWRVEASLLRFSVCVQMCVYMYVYMCVHICVYMCTCICMYMHICVSVWMYAYTCICTRMWAYICTHVGASCFGHLYCPIPLLHACVSQVFFQQLHACVVGYWKWGFFQLVHG